MKVEQAAHAVPAESVELCPLRSVMPSHYKPDGACRCADLDPTETKVLTACGSCTGTGKVSKPGARYELVTCPACNGECVR